MASKTASVQKLESAERPFKSARLQARTSAVSSSINSGSDEVTLASTYDPAGYDPVSHPHPTGPRSKLPRRQPRKINPASHPLAPLTPEETAQGGSMGMHVANAYAASPAPGMAPMLFTQLPQMPGQLQHLKGMHLASNAPVMNPQDPAASKQQQEGQLHQHVQLPQELMQRFVLVQGPYGIQAVPAAALAATPQGMIHLQRLHQHAQLHATTATLPKSCDAKSGVVNAPSSATDGSAGATTANAASVSMHAAPVAPVAASTLSEASAADVHTAQEARPLQARSQLATESATVPAVNTVSTGAPVHATAAVALGMPAIPEGVQSKIHTGKVQAAEQGSMMGATGLVAGTPVNLTHAVPNAPVAASSVPSGFAKGGIMHSTPGVVGMVSGGTTKRKNSGGRKSSRPQRALM